MKAKHFVKLEAAVEKFVNEMAGNFEDDFDGYYHDELVTQMARAAEQVIDAAFSAQKFAKYQIS